MDEQERLCDLCGQVSDTEAQLLDCGWLNQACGSTPDLEDPMTAAA